MWDEHGQQTVALAPDERRCVGGEVPEGEPEPVRSEERRPPEVIDWEDVRAALSRRGDELGGEDLNEPMRT